MKIYDKKKFWSGLGILAIGILFFFYDLSSPSANGFQAKWNLILGLIVMPAPRKVPRPGPCLQRGDTLFSSDLPKKPP